MAKLMVLDFCRNQKNKDAQVLRMSITEIIANRGLQEMLANAVSHYTSMGIAGQALQRCIDYTIRYCLNNQGAMFDHAPSILFKAIAHVATKHVADLLANQREPRSLEIYSENDSSMQYWIEKACAAIDIDTWLDDSLDKWFFDWQSPLASLVVQACRRKVLDHVASCAMHGIPLNHDDLVLDIVAELQGKFPALNRFMRHLPVAIDDAIEHEVLGVPIIEPAVTSPIGELAEYSPASGIRGHTNSLY
jgi:hypothetical protein